MLQLLFDTCFNKTYILLKNSEDIIAEKIIESDNFNYHTANLIPTIRDILKKNNILVKDINVIAVNIGPGSFTGIRVGITIARVLAQQFNIPVVGINSFEILSKINNTEMNTVIVSDARKEMVYFSNGNPIEPKLIEKTQCVNHINDNSFVIADSNISLFLKENNIQSVNYEKLENNFAFYMSDALNEKLMSESLDEYHWAKIKPLYIQKPSITKPKNAIN